jgi:hypothetical protein
MLEIIKVALVEENNIAIINFTMHMGMWYTLISYWIPMIDIDILLYNNLIEEVL